MAELNLANIYVSRINVKISLSFLKGPFFITVFSDPNSVSTIKTVQSASSESHRPGTEPSSASIQLCDMEEVP